MGLRLFNKGNNTTYGCHKNVLESCEGTDIKSFIAVAMHLPLFEIYKIYH